MQRGYDQIKHGHYTEMSDVVLMEVHALLKLKHETYTFYIF